MLSQYLLPKQALTALAGKLAHVRGGRLTRAVIAWFVRRYGVVMDEAAEPDIRNYATFNEFFTRPLRDGARPLAAADFVCPVDGAISQFGTLERDCIVQAKGHRYSVTALLGGDTELAAQFADGSFATLYLSPRDYHRIHMPCDGRLRRMIYVPGTLFSVNPVTVRGIPDLFARNERVVCVFDSAHGPFVMTLVGATIVGSMTTVWHGMVNPPRGRAVRTWHYDEPRITLRQGEEMGRFQLGSTVIVLFARNVLCFNEQWSPERVVRLGEPLGLRIESGALEQSQSY